MLLQWYALISLAVVILIFTAFPSINLFDAVSWFTVASGVLALVLHILLFRDKMTISCLRIKESCNEMVKSVNFKSAETSTLAIIVISSLYIVSQYN